MKNFKKLFVSIFILIFSSTCFLNTFTFLAMFDPFAETYSYSLVDDFGVIDSKIFWKSKYDRKNKQTNENSEVDRMIITQYQRTDKNHDANKQRFPNYTQLYGRQKK